MESDLEVSPIRKTASDRWVYGGVGLVLLLIITAIGFPPVLEGIKLGRDTAALNKLKELHKAEKLYHSKHNCYGTLLNLADDGLIDRKLLQATFAYHFEAKASINTVCIYATRESSDSAYRDFSIDETGIVNLITSERPKFVPCLKDEEQRGVAFPR
jgi:hypothetical protein